MKTMVLSQYNQPLEVNDREIPRVESGEVLLKVKACGICQTDLKIIKGAIPPPIVTLPHVLGHEVAGEVTAEAASTYVTVGAVTMRGAWECTSLE